MLILLAGATLALATWTLSGSGAAQEKQTTFKKFLPPKAYKELVTRAAQAIETNLAAAEDEDNLHRAQAYAAMIEGYALSAQQAGTTGVRSAASELSRIAADKANLVQAKKLAAELALLKGQPAATERIPTKYPEDIGDLMNLLKPKAKGGEGIAASLQSNIRLKGALNGIEEKIRALAKKKQTDERAASEAPELTLLGYKLAVLAELTVFHAAPRKGKGTQKDWNELSFQMRDSSLDMAAAAAQKDADGTFNAANKLNSTCSQCHSLFR